MRKLLKQTLALATSVAMCLSVASPVLTAYADDATVPTKTVQSAQTPQPASTPAPAQPAAPVEPAPVEPAEPEQPEGISGEGSAAGHGNVLILGDGRDYDDIGDANIIPSDEIIPPEPEGN